MFTGVISAISYLAMYVIARSYFGQGTESVLPTLAWNVVLFKAFIIFLTGVLMVYISKNSLGVVKQVLEETNTKEQIKKMFGQHVSPEIANRIIGNEMNGGGSVEEITVLFSDIRGFTSFSADKRPDEIVNFLNEYFSKMCGIVVSHGGVVNKFIGDGMLAIFGAPTKLENHAHSALDAAIEMREAARTINGNGVEIVVGIYTGKVFAGVVGFEERLEYTVIGDPVNRASRLEQVAKKYGETIVFGETTALMLPDFVAKKSIGKVRLKGINEDVAIYAPQ